MPSFDMVGGVFRRFSSVFPSGFSAAFNYIMVEQLGDNIDCEMLLR